MSTLNDKDAARQAAFAARKAAFRTGLDAAAQGALREALAPYAGRVLSGFMPIRTEIDPVPVMAGWDGPVCVPVIVGKARPLDFHRWTPGCAMVLGPFGARVPAEAEVLTPEVLIVPLLAFDARGFRLGYGGGFYDRTLERLRASRATVAIGYAFGAQEVAEVPIEPTDQRLDMIVTEAGVTHFD
ncbi:MAG: 5-formyltetrahydrofolate cyclo-ligase [Rhodobacter sp.]|nr:5-formyltetrahydrofolate cyclo-ligase [Rhodobacter sp.]